MKKLAEVVAFAVCVAGAIYTHQHGMGDASDALTIAAVVVFALNIL